MVLVLIGGAFYAARGSENSPKVVYSASLEDVAEANEPLLININTADVEELDELPEVGPATAQEIVDHRRANGLFRSVDESHRFITAKPRSEFLRTDIKGRRRAV
ncbi:MAG: helix-hairpin-helix domain-containing protein [Actinomycetota bacterium]|nr:helix-hairpin-helix domain-containing protein [Actinomycetota bacterium]